MAHNQGWAVGRSYLPKRKNIINNNNNNNNNKPREEEKENERGWVERKFKKHNFLAILMTIRK